jgi:hypothetical protein
MATAAILGLLAVVGPLCALGALALVRTAVTCVASRCVHGSVGHGVGSKARRSIGVAVAALDAGNRDVRRRGVAGCRDTIVAIRAVRIGRLMDICAAGPTRVGRLGGGVTGYAVLPAGRHVTGIGRRTISTLGSLARVAAIVAGVTTAATDRRVRHRVGREARRGIGVTAAALHGPRRDVRWRRHTGRRRAVVAARAIRIGRLMDVSAARPAGETGCRCGVTGDAVTPAGRDVAGVRRCAHRTLCAFGCVGPVVAGIAAAGAHRGVRHRVGREADRGIIVAVAALHAGHRNVRRRGQACRRRTIMAAGTVRVGR